MFKTMRQSRPTSKFFVENGSRREAYSTVLYSPVSLLSTYIYKDGPSLPLNNSHTLSSLGSSWNGELESIIIMQNLLHFYSEGNQKNLRCKWQQKAASFSCLKLLKQILGKCWKCVQESRRCTAHWHDHSRIFFLLYLVQNISFLILWCFVVMCMFL